MAQQQGLIDIQSVQVVQAYAGVNDAQPTIQGRPEGNWADDDLGHIMLWHGTALNDAEILAQGQLFLSELNNNTISQRTAARGLKLAMNIKTPEPPRTSKLLTQQPRGEVNQEGVYAAIAMPGIDTFSSTPFTIRAQQVVQKNVNAPLPQAAPVVAQNLVQDAGANLPTGNDTDEERVSSYTYIAAYLMKLLVKDDNNVTLGLENMKRRYESFYGLSRTITSFSLTTQQAAAYKEALLSVSFIQTTYTVALAYTQNHSTGVHTPREEGLLSYLGYLPFSYTGLHAYTLMIELRNFSNVKIGVLLSLFQADINAPALAKIADIIANQERTVQNPNRTTYFRYCALWGAHYYASLRSRNCPHLTYTVAMAWKRLSSSHDNADPERIMSTRTLSEAMKLTLRAAGTIIGDSLKANMLGGANVSSEYTMALNAPRLVAQPDNEWGI